jgi:ABC-type transporter Mla subunit MlaD
MGTGFVAILPFGTIPEYWIALIVGSVFLLLQLGLCAAFISRMRRFRTVVSYLGQLGQQQASRYTDQFFEITERFPWIAWVDEHFPEDGVGGGRFTRDDALQELDTRIAGDSRYLLLQRAGVMAPLLGVLITVGGFLALRLPDSDELQLQNILLAVTPLVAGVGLGAALAFINQWLLHLSGGSVESLRTKARDWFDANVWNRIDNRPQEVQDKLVDAMASLAASVNESAAQHTENAGVLQSATAQIGQAADDLGQSIASLGSQLKDLPQTFSSLRSVLSRATSTIEEAGIKGQQIVCGLDVSVSAFRSAVDHCFLPATQDHKSLVESLARSVQYMEQSVKCLAAGSQTISDVLAAHDRFNGSLYGSLESNLLPAQQDLRKATSSLRTATRALAQEMKTLRAAVETSCGHVDSYAPTVQRATDELLPAAGTIRRIVDGELTPVISDHRVAVQSLAASAGQLEQAVRSLQNTAATIEVLTRHQIQAGQNLASVGQSWRQVLEDQVLPVLDTIAGLPEQIRTALVENVVRDHGNGEAKRVKIAN